MGLRCSGLEANTTQRFILPKRVLRGSDRRQARKTLACAARAARHVRAGEAIIDG